MDNPANHRRASHVNRRRSVNCETPWNWTRANGEHSCITFAMGLRLFWLEVARHGLRIMVPGLRQHAVFALANIALSGAIGGYVAPPHPFPPLLGLRSDLVGQSRHLEHGRKVLGRFCVFMHRRIRKCPIVEDHCLDVGR